MILNCNVGFFIDGLDADVLFGVFDEVGRYHEYTKDSIPDMLIDKNACISKNESMYTLIIKK